MEIIAQIPLMSANSIMLVLGVMVERADSLAIEAPIEVKNMMRIRVIAVQRAQHVTGSP